MLDYDLLREKIRSMHRHSPIFRILKEELSRLGYWKNKPRGNPKAGYEASRKERQE